jgi:ElaB/YqjD/DUF883 family membrane-anchored ribosome-binding protein
MEIIDPYQTPSVPLTPETSPETDGIRAQIEQTRDGMSQTIDEIQSRLTPSHLVGQAVDTVKSAAQDAASGAAEHVAGAAQTATNATVEALTQLLNTLRNSPAFMAALPGLIAALLNSGRAAVAGAEQGVQQGVERAGEQARNASTATMEATSALWESIRQNPALMGALVSGLTWILAQGTNAMAKASEARQKAADVAGQARETTEELGAQAQQQAQRAAGWLQRAVEQNPLVVALVAVAIGAAIGLSSKPTQLEHQVMGPTRDRMLEQAQNLAKELATTAAATAATAMVAHAASNATSQTAPRSTEDEP